MANTIIGRVLCIGPAVNVSKQKEFLKRELVLDISRYDRYSGDKMENYATFHFVQKRCAELDALRENDLVEVTFMLSGRKYEKDGQIKYITDIIGYKVEKKGGDVAASQAEAEGVTYPAMSSDEGELPF